LANQGGKEDVANNEFQSLKGGVPDAQTTEKNAPPKRASVEKDEMAVDIGELVVRIKTRIWKMGGGRCPQSLAAPQS